MSNRRHAAHHGAEHEADSVRPGHPHHDQPSGHALTRLAVSATLHCLTGCAIGEILGLVLATWVGQRP
jgi:hypothetical protein